MRITTDHPSSSYGIPVILNDSGEVMDYAPGIKAVRDHLGFTVSQVAEAVGKSKRTVEGWEQGRTPPAESLYILAGLLARPVSRP